MEPLNHDHQHAPNRFAVIPTPVRLNANPEFTGNGVVIAFLDSGFYPHPDLGSRIIAYHDIAGEQHELSASGPVESSHWHGTQTSVAAAGNGQLSDGLYRGVAHESKLVLVKVSQRGRISEENIARGIRWVIANRERYNIRILNISLGGDEDVPCSKSIIDRAAEEAISRGIVVVAAAGNSGRRGSTFNSARQLAVGDHGRWLFRQQRVEWKSRPLSLEFRRHCDGTVKPEIVAPAMWIAAPILPGTPSYEQAEALSQLAVAPNVDAALQQQHRRCSLISAQGSKRSREPWDR